METYKIGLVVGSLRKDSWTGRTAAALSRVAPAGLSFDRIGIGDLPLYNPDFDEAPPAEWARFRDAVRPLDGILFVTPEYNRSVPGGLKNALDVGSRPYGASVWDGKPAAVVSASPGLIGGFGANHHLRQTLAYLNMQVLAQPEMYLSSVADRIGEDGIATSDEARAFLEKFMTAFASWVARFR